MMHGRGKSSPVIVARKPANKADPETISAAESVERRAGAEGNANQHARTGLSAGHAWTWLASIRQAAMLDCQNPRREPYAGKLQVRIWAGGARQLASLPRQRNFAAPAHVRSCAGFRTPAATISPHALAAGVRKPPRHEIASGDGAPAVPRATGAAI